MSKHVGIAKNICVVNVIAGPNPTQYTKSDKLGKKRTNKLTPNIRYMMWALYVNRAQLIACCLLRAPEALAPAHCHAH